MITNPFLCFRKINSEGVLCHGLYVLLSSGNGKLAMQEKVYNETIQDEYRTKYKMIDCNTKCLYPSEEEQA